MNFDTENPFDPLINFVKNEDYDFDSTMEKFMYMGDEDDVFYYKDYKIRDYLKLDGKGNRVGGRW